MGAEDHKVDRHFLECHGRWVWISILEFSQVGLLYENRMGHKVSGRFLERHIPTRARP